MQFHWGDPAVGQEKEGRGWGTADLELACIKQGQQNSRIPNLELSHEINLHFE